MTRSEWAPEEVPIDRPNVARMYDYFLGGGHNFAVDREAAERIFAIYADLPIVAQANRAFLRRAVQYLLEVGIDQLLDIGSGIPTAGNVHEIVQSAGTTARVVYVDIDPVAVAHSRALLENVPNTLAIQGDARQPEELLARPQLRSMLDFSRPMAVLLVALIHFVPEDAVAKHIVRTLRDALAPGSYIVITHATTERIEADDRQDIEQLYRGASSPFHFRTREQIAALFENLDLVEPGLVYIPLWRPEGADDLLVDEPDRSNGYAGVGRKA
jgi:hypothetical protein